MSFDTKDFILMKLKQVAITTRYIILLTLYGTDILYEDFFPKEVPVTPS